MSLASFLFCVNCISVPHHQGGAVSLASFLFCVNCISVSGVRPVGRAVGREG